MNFEEALDLIISCLLSPLRPYLLPRLRVVSPCSSYLFHFIQHACRSFSLSDILASHYSQHLSSFFSLFVLIFIVVLVWIVLMCSRTRYASISLAFTLINWGFALFFLSHCLWAQNWYLSRMKNQLGHWVYTDVGQKKVWYEANTHMVALHVFGRGS